VIKCDLGVTHHLTSAFYHGNIVLVHPNDSFGVGVLSDMEEMLSSLAVFDDTHPLQFVCLEGLQVETEIAFKRSASMWRLCVPYLCYVLNETG
jgi:hypothetical protein